MNKLFLIAMLVSATASARDHRTVKDDGSTVKRLMYTDVWRRNISEFFAENKLGPTKVILIKNNLIIDNVNCHVAEVKEALTDMFSEPRVREILRETQMTITCVDTRLASN